MGINLFEKLKGTRDTMMWTIFLFFLLAVSARPQDGVDGDMLAETRKECEKQNRECQRLHPKFPDRLQCAFSMAQCLLKTGFCKKPCGDQYQSCMADPEKSEGTCVGEAIVCIALHCKPLHY